MEDLVGKLFFGVIAAIVGFGLLQIREPVNDLAITLAELFDVVIEPLSAPFLRLYERFADPIKEKLVPLTSRLPLTMLSERFPVLGSPGTIRFFLLALAYIIIAFYTQSTAADLSNYVSTLFYNTSLGTVFALILSDTSITLVTVVSAGFTSFLSLLFFRSTVANDECDDVSLPRKIILFFYHTVYACAACIISLQLSGLWEYLANTGTGLYQTLSVLFHSADHSFVGILQMIGSGLLLGLLLYVGVLLGLIAVREHIYNIGFGISAVVCMAGLFLLIYAFVPDALLIGVWGDIAGYILLAVTFIYTDYCRANLFE